jgi:hypothetical protein
MVNTFRHVMLYCFHSIELLLVMTVQLLATKDVMAFGLEHKTDINDALIHKDSYYPINIQFNAIAIDYRRVLNLDVSSQIIK